MGLFFVNRLVLLAMSGETVSGNPILIVPSSKGIRPWKQPKARPASAQRRIASLKLSLEQKKKKRAQQEVLRKIVRVAKQSDAAAKESERKRRVEKRKLKEENLRRGVQPVVVTNRKKLAQMSKKQYLNYVHKNKVFN